MSFAEHLLGLRGKFTSEATVRVRSEGFSLPSTMPLVLATFWLCRPSIGRILWRAHQRLTRTVLAGFPPPMMLLVAELPEEVLAALLNLDVAVSDALAAETAAFCVFN